MIEQSTFNIIVWVWIGIALLVFPLTLKVTAPYGRHSKTGWGPMIPNKLGWVLMEIPSLVLFSYFFLTGSAEKTTVHWILWALWTVHYFNRTIIFPLRTRTKKKKMPAVIASFAMFFNLVNGTLNGYWLGNFSTWLTNDHMLHPLFIIGMILFVAGFIMNQAADNRLINLRKNSTSYSIPYGGLFRWISCPNFFSEIIEWGGYALMSLSLPSLSFFVWTFVNLVPRALDHHRWYKENFSDYPKERKAIFPHIL